MGERPPTRNPPSNHSSDGFVIRSSRLGSVHDVVQQANKGSAIMSFPQPRDSSESVGSRDGHGAGDHDQPYRFGWRPRASVPYPFNTRQYARLLVLRSRLQDGVAGEVEADGTSSLAAAA